MKREIPRGVFLAIAVFFVAGAVFHLVALAHPAAGDQSPPWRHGLFLLINVVATIGMVWRPRGFAVAFAVLTAQQLWSHGTGAVVAWRDEQRVDWASVLVVIGMPLVLALLVADARARRR